MKALRITLALFAVATVALATMTSATMPPRWEQLGSKIVNFGLDRDEINVTMREGLFTAVKFRVMRSGINMHKCVIHFSNGGTQEVELRNNFTAGSESRVIDLDGGARGIQKVVFWYDTKNIRNRKGVIELWGRH
jgi:hypothetical protein